MSVWFRVWAKWAFLLLIAQMSELQTKNMLQINIIVEKDLSYSDNYQFVWNSAMLNLVLFL